MAGAAAAGVMLLSACTSARAAEHVTLRNGFELNCERHQPLGPDGVRLYMHGQENYLDLRAADIVGIDVVPDPPAVAKAAELTRAFTAQDVGELLASAGAAHNIDRDLLASVVHNESGGHANAVSKAGARGLMQLMPGTAKALGVKDSSRPDQNIAGGTAYLDELLKRYKDDLGLALAAYNAGPGAVDRYHGIPPFRETRAYVARVIRDFNRRKQAVALTSVATVGAPR